MKIDPHLIEMMSKHPHLFRLRDFHAVLRARDDIPEEIKALSRSLEREIERRQTKKSEGINEKA